MLAPHFAVARAVQAANLESDVNPRVAGGKVAGTTGSAVVPTRMLPAAFLADRSF